VTQALGGKEGGKQNKLATDLIRQDGCVFSVPFYLLTIKIVKYQKIVKLEH